MHLASMSVSITMKAIINMVVICYCFQKGIMAVFKRDQVQSVCYTGQPVTSFTMNCMFSIGLRYFVGVVT